ncbi:MAG: glycosyltransferase family 2 protein, partial [Ekhidna sp.]
DCSTDNTADDIGNQFNILKLPVNLGIGGAVQAGYLFADENDFDIAIQVDGDGQHKPEDILKLVNHLVISNTDMVVGSRFIENVTYTPPLARRVGMAFSRGLLYLGTGTRVEDTTSGFRAINRKLISFFARNYTTTFAGVIPLAMLLKNGYKLEEIPAQFEYRTHGKSSINFLKSIYYPLQTTISLLGVLIRK